MKFLERSAAASALALAGVLALHGAALAAEVRVMISAGFSPAFDRLVPEFERRTGDHVVTVRGPSMGDTPEAIPNRIARGEPVDVVIMAGDALDRLASTGALAPGGHTDLARSRIGVVVKAGAPKPDVSTPEALRAALLQARSIAYSDSDSGVYVSTELFKKLGVEEQVRGKARMIPATPVARIVAQGGAEIGFQQISALLPEAGAAYLGPLPESLQKVTVFAAGLAAKAHAPAEARALVAFLASPQAATEVAATGLDPLPRP